MRPGRLLIVGILISALLGCATNHSQSGLSSYPRDHTKPNTTTQKGVVQAALSLLGSPYRFGGMTPEGFDCTGFINYVFRHSADMILPRESHSLVRAGRPVSAKDLQPADLVYFKIERQKPLHVGIYIGEGRFIHAPSSGGKVNIQDLKGDYWGKRYLGARRVI